MKVKHSYLLFSFIFLLVSPAFSQKIGLVLSGGGASGIAHIGVIKALEENHIPIDYITGTSMGAFIGALYAAGYTPEQMEQMVTSKEFQEIAVGTINSKYTYYFKQGSADALWITFRFAFDTNIISSIPTHLISPLPVDFTVMKYFSMASSASGENFDSLFVPFRCVAADIVAKKPYVFKSGNLGQSIRASISYPFYLKPMSINGKMFFDGGLYNNFPADIMQQDFKPDFIIGSNVSGNIQPPSDDDILSEIKNMLMTRTNYSLPGKGMIIVPDVDAGILTTDNPKALIDSGYIATLRQIPALLKMIDRRASAADLQKRRENFEKKEHPLVFNKLVFNGINFRQAKYLKSVLFSKHSGLFGRQQKLSVDDIAPGYFRVATDPNIHSIYPLAKYNDTSGYYTLDMKIKKEKHFQGSVGGVISNRPISDVYAGLQYNTFGREEIQLNANGYVGRLYNSFSGSARIYTQIIVPVYFEPAIVYNQWNYYTSSTDFFNFIQPPYLTQWEGFGRMDMGIPIGSKSKLIFGGGYTNINSSYFFQNIPYKPADTTNQTLFGAVTGYAKCDYNSLNDKEYATSGARFLIQGQWIAGTENYTPGSQEVIKRDTSIQHNWLQVKLTFDKYFIGKGPVRMGIYAEGVYSNSFIQGHALQTYFTNYDATALMAPAFQPTPEMQTLFLPFYRAFNYAAGGLKLIKSHFLLSMLDLRLEGYAFFPYQAIQANPNTNQAVYGTPLDVKNIEYAGMAALVFHFPIGPVVSISLNYFDNDQTDPLKYSYSVLFHVGFIIFNERSVN
ncbi:MAG: patatin-like phospholipase family protein [Bacteroidia bacterium]